MESLGVFAEGDQWECISRLFTSEDQELDFTPHFIGHEGSSFPFQHNEGSFNFTKIPCPAHHCDPDSQAGNEMGMNRLNQSLFHSLDTVNSSMNSLLQENNSCYSTIMNPESYYFGGYTPMSNDISTSMDVSMTGSKNNIGPFIPAFSDMGMEGAVCNNEDSGSGKTGFSDDSQPPIELQRKRVHDHVAEKKNKIDNAESNPKKKPRVSKEKTKKNTVRARKGQKVNLDVIVKDVEESNNNPGVDKQSSSSYTSSEDDNASQETDGAGEISDPKSSSALNLNGKTRANRGSATDPQSLYARKRRERINERLRVLQNLVPNGTKVDISTMLEEAVHYVKFLQLQIKLLSSDDMWMYSPIAYNGMDIGLDLHKMATLL